MAWGIAIGAGLNYLSSQEQADEMSDATGAQVQLQREKFRHAQDLLEELRAQQEPRRIAGERATRSLSMMAGLGDPGPSQAGTRSELSTLQDKLGETDKFITTGGRVEKIRRSDLGGDPDRQPARLGSRFIPEETKPNPEFQRLEEEIAALEGELEAGAQDEFTGPRDVTEMPGFQFTRDQGLEALGHSGAARGMQLSGRQMEGITEFGQRHAMTFRSQLMEELRSLAGFQPTQTTTAQANLATGEANAISPLLGQMGQIGAAETAGKFSGLGAFVSEFGNNTTTTTGVNAIDPSVGGYGNMTFSPGGTF